MKILRKSIILLGAAIFLISAAMSITAESDPTGDVFHWKGTNWTNWDWNVQNRPNVDISDVSYTAGDRLTISLSVVGSINSAKSYYHVWFNSSDAWYHLHYYPDQETEPFIAATPLNFAEWSMEDLMNYTQPESEASITGGNTITATIDWVTDDHTMLGFYGWAQEWDEDGGMAVDAWYDFAPNSFAWYGDYDDYADEEPDDNGTPADGTEDNGGTDSSTPGFEIIAVICGIAILIFVKKRK